MRLSQHLRPVLDMLFPPRCVSCGRLGTFLCDTCLQEAQAIDARVCIHCGVPMTQRGQCPHCRIDPPTPLRAIRGVFFFQGPIRQGIHSLKYEGRHELAPILARPLAQYLHDHPIPLDFIVPVPLHPERQAQRGYNQSALLARALGRLRHLPVHEHALQRIRATQSQTHLSRQERLANVRGAFAATENLKNARVLLVDDVATTGATLRACAQALQQAGATHIWALTVARAHPPYPIEVQMGNNTRIPP